jgi:hypothetical protein
LFSLHRVKSSSVSDDFHFHFKKEKHLNGIFAAITFMKDELGLDLRGPKMKLLCPHPTPKITGLDMEYICTPASILGSVVYPPHCSTLTPIDFLMKTKNCLKKSLGKVAASCEFILKCPASIQIKYAVLRSLQFSSLYLMASMTPSHTTEQVLETIELHYLNLFYTLFDVPPQYRDPEHQVRTQSPIEDGGLGLLPLCFLRPHLYENNQFEANILRRTLGLVEVENVRKNGDLKLIWKTFSPTHQKEMSYHQGSFLSVWPSKPLLTIDDATFAFGVQHRLGFLPPIDAECIHSLINLNTLSPHEFITHFERCSACGSAMWTLRHERVNYVLGKTFKYHNIVCELNPPDLPLPGNARGGPDFLLFISSKVYAGDVVVTARRTCDAFSGKIRKYNDFSEATTFETFPFAMNTRGKVDYSTYVILQKIQTLSTSKKLVTDIISHAQIEMLKGMYTGYVRLRARKLARTLYDAQTDDDGRIKRHREPTQTENDRNFTVSASRLSSSTTPS